MLDATALIIIFLIAVAIIAGVVSGENKVLSSDDKDEHSQVSNRGRVMVQGETRIIFSDENLKAIPPSGRSRIFANILAWGLFAWAVVCSIDMTWAAVDLHLQGYRPDGFEFEVGVLLGLPSWIGLPIFVAFLRRSLSRPMRVVLLLPMILAVLTFIVALSLGNVLHYKERHLILEISPQGQLRTV